jgi:hypothetical protein
LQRYNVAQNGKLVAQRYCSSSSALESRNTTFDCGSTHSKDSLKEIRILHQAECNIHFLLKNTQAHEKDIEERV